MSTKEKMELQLNGIGDLVPKDTEKAEMTESLDLLFTGKFCPQSFHSAQVGVLGRKLLPIVKIEL